MAVPSGFDPATNTRHPALMGVRSLRNSDGKGIIGCIILLALIGVAIVLAIGLGPLYYSHSRFQSAVKTEVSRAGSQSLNDEAIIEGILALAEKNRIKLARKNIQVERFAGQVHIEVDYSVPVSFIFLTRDVRFQIRESSFIGTP